ncbi:MAG TPA: hypothetical protein VMI11_14605 [Actinomycetes bacterium]|nr:hypothetical protein [Actinomycetes bacterium]
MVDLPPRRAALFVAWGNAFLAGDVDPDTASAAIRGRDESHEVMGLSQDRVTLPVALQVLAREGARGFRLVLPVAGDVSGLPGPPAFNAAALEAGEAVLVTSARPLGAVPTLTGTPDAVRVSWTASPVAHRSDGPPSLTEAERELAGAMREATDLLTSLDIARLGPESADLLAALRGGAFDGPRLPPGLPPRADEVAVRGRRLAAIVTLARADDGGALSAGEATRRREALAPLDRAARRAICAAFSAGAHQEH